MSVEFKSSIIYGYDCSDLIEKFSFEELEELEEIGWDYIRDCYSDDFMYIGVKISNVYCGEEQRIDVLKAMNSSLQKFAELLHKTPDKYKILFPLSGSLYHICYAV